MTLDHNDKRAIRNLLTALEERSANTIPIEQFRTPNNGVVEGWRIIFGPGRDFTVTRPGTPGDVALDRAELVAVLRREWAPKAAVAVDLPVTPVGPVPPPKVLRKQAAPDVTEQAGRFLAEMQSAMQWFVDDAENWSLDAHRSHMAAILKRLEQAQRDLRHATQEQR